MCSLLIETDAVQMKDSLKKASADAARVVAVETIITSRPVSSTSKSLSSSPVLLLVVRMFNSSQSVRQNVFSE